MNQWSLLFVPPLLAYSAPWIAGHSFNANTLLIANTMGFHRRGEFAPGKTRDLLMIRFGDRSSKKRQDAS